MHSFLLISTSEQAIRNKAQTIVPFPISENTPDALVIEVEKRSIGIDTVKHIKSFLSRKPYQQSVKVVFIPRAEALTIPAQNALLKTLEEPPANSILILGSPHEAKLVPTIVSRCQAIYLTAPSSTITAEVENSITSLLAQLATTTPGQKITLAANFVTHAKAVTLCQDLLVYLRARLKKTPTKKLVNRIKLVQKTHERLEQNVDPRLAIEHLFLNLQFDVE